MSSPEGPVVADLDGKTKQQVSSAVAAALAGTGTREPAPEPPPVQFFEKRKTVHNRRIDGPFRRFKWAIMVITLAIYYGTPWIRWDRGPYAPDQAVLIDLANRRFYMFGIEIWPQEFYFVAGLLIMAGIGLFLVTSAVGRAWCGYACPQTVWTDVFQHIDRFVDGSILVTRITDPGVRPLLLLPAGATLGNPRPTAAPLAARKRRRVSENIAGVPAVGGREPSGG